MLTKSEIGIGEKEHQSHLFQTFVKICRVCLMDS